MTSTQADLDSLEAGMPPLDAPTDELATAARKAVEPVTPEASKEKSQQKDPRTKTAYPFTLKWIDKRGKAWRGDFQNTRLTIKDQQAMGLLQARFGGGMSYEALDPMTREINLMIAHMMISLDQEICPPWAKDLRELDSIPLLQAIYREVADHEAIFHGLPAFEGGSQKGG